MLVGSGLLAAWLVMLAAGTADAGSSRAVDAGLVGEWSLNGQPFIIFKADGTGTMEGEPFRWTADGLALVITDAEGTERLPYRVTGRRLSVTMEGTRLVLERMGREAAAGEGPRGKTGSAKAAGEGPRPPAATPGRDPVSHLLLSSAWCSFSYNQTSGASQSSRAQFSPDGTWSSASRGETYSSGYGGTVAGQHDAGLGGQWKVQEGRLFMSNPPDSPALSPVDLSITRNSSGHPIITADGTEYSPCE